MKNKILSVLSLGIMLLTLTGCVKFNATMDIKKDKSMDYSIIYAFDKNFFGEDQVLSDEDKSKLEKKGFTISDYSDDNMKGFTISKSFSNIDEISSSVDTVYNISGLLDDTSSDTYVFKVDKGFFKNTYHANFNFDASDSEIDSEIESNDEGSIIDDEIYYDNEEDTYSEENEESSMDFSEFTNSLTNNMDLKFRVNLPYSAKNSNATNTNNDNKELSWNLSSNELQNIEFEFELYNMKNIYIFSGILVLILIIILLSVINSRKNKPVNKKIPTTPADNTNPVAMANSNLNANNQTNNQVTANNIANETSIEKNPGTINQMPEANILQPDIADETNTQPNQNVMPTNSVAESNSAKYGSFPHINLDANQSNTTFQTSDSNVQKNTINPNSQNRINNISNSNQENSNNPFNI